MRFSWMILCLVCFSSQFSFGTTDEEIKESNRQYEIEKVKKIITGTLIANTVIFGTFGGAGYGIIRYLGPGSKTATIITMTMFSTAFATLINTASLLEYCCGRN